MKSRYRQNLGKWGEAAAAQYLTQLGFTVRGMNVRTPEGEIDLIVEKAGEVHFVEVKARTSSRYGNPEEAVTRRKFEHMTRAAEWFLAEQNVAAGTWHLDVIAIQGRPGVEELQFEWFKDVEVE